VAISLCLIFCSTCWTEETENKQGGIYSTWDNPVEFDRAATAWMIRKWIDPEAKFVFTDKGSMKMPGIPYDVPVAEDSRRGNRPVAKFWADKYQLQDPALEKILELAHDIEINVWQTKRTAEAPGVEAVIQGLNEMYPDRPECLGHCIQVVEALYRHFRMQTKGIPGSRKTGDSGK
jgi:hypothetical protein